MPERPGGPPVDRDGEIIGDIPWKFFNDPPGAPGERRD